MTRSRGFRLALATALIVAGQAVVLSAAASPAAADVPGHIAVRSPSRPYHSDPSDVQTAWCPDGKFVVGGGGYVEDGGHNAVRLTRIQPVHSAAGDHVTAAAEEPAGGVFVGQWRVVAVAICADPLPGYEIVADSTSVASPTFIDTLARCPAGKLVVGTGAKVTNGYGEVWLQLMRSSGPRDIARATAREDADGQDSSWYLTAYAICANPTPRTVSYGGVTDRNRVNTLCDLAEGHHFTMSIGGGGGLTDSGPYWLTGLYVFPFGLSPESLNVSMSGVPTSGMAWGGICSDW